MLHIMAKKFIRESSKGRLGLGREFTYGHGLRSQDAVPFPTQLNLKKRIVALSAGGWSFHALDDEGNIHAWGQLDGLQMVDNFRRSTFRIHSCLSTFTSNCFSLQGFSSDGFADASKISAVPIMLDLPERMRAIRFVYLLIFRILLKPLILDPDTIHPVCPAPAVVTLQPLIQKISFGSFSAGAVLPDW